MTFKNLISAVTVAMAIGTAPVTAATIGYAVDGMGSSTSVGSTTYRPLMGMEAMKYYIPLTSSGTCTYGAGCGISSDNGTGGTEMSMFLRFDGTSTTSTSHLEIKFEDLDLVGVNDPWYFTETLEIFDSLGSSLTNLITDISSPYVEGNKDTQQLLKFNLGILPSSTTYLELVFTADSEKRVRNTAEYLSAHISSVPLPAAGWMLLAALGGIFAVKRRKSLAA